MSTSTQKTSTSRKVKLILSISLIINVIAISLLLGWGMRHSFFKGDRHHSYKMESMLQEGLPADIAEQASQHLKAFRNTRKKIHRQFSQDRKNIASLLTAENFDQDHFTQALSDNRQAREVLMNDLTQQLSQLAAMLPLEKRKLLAEYITRKPRMSHHKKKQRAK